MIQFRLNEADILKLKTPLGRLIPGDPQNAMPALKTIIGRIHPDRITSVGDIVSRETLAAGIPVDVRIIDHRSMRRPTSSLNVKARNTYRVTNPAGVITMASWEVVKRAMKEHDVLILVDGEEDLLTLPCIVESPDNAIVLYGQPSQGLVVVETSPPIKREASLILERMTREETGHR